MAYKGYKILIMYDFFSEIGGVERIIDFQARTLRKAGYSVDFGFSYVDDKLKKDSLKGFNIVEYGKLKIKNETLQISTAFMRNKPLKLLKDYDLIICHSFPSSFLALRIKKKFGTKVILHLHHPPQFLYSADLSWAKNTFKRKFSFFAGKLLKSPLKKFDRYCVNGFSNFITECKAVDRIIKETYGMNGFISYPTVNSFFHRKTLTKSELKEMGLSKEYILGSGRIIEQKRFDYLVSAVSLLKDKKNFQVVLVGKQDEATKIKLEKLAKENGVELILLGSAELTKLNGLYSSALATVLTCPKEWFGLVPIESMACGTPVVGWRDNFGPQETIIPEVSGYLAKPYDIKDLSEKIEKAIKKNWDRKKIIESSKRFSEEKIGKELVSYVGKIVKEN